MFWRADGAIIYHKYSHTSDKHSDCKLYWIIMGFDTDMGAFISDHETFISAHVTFIGAHVTF